jgi:hypothetical protein
MCAFCCREVETTTHILWEYLFANSVWALSSGKIQKCKVSSLNIILLARSLKSSLSKEELEMWATTAWSIWNARNKFIIVGSQQHLSFIFDRGREML